MIKEIDASKQMFPKYAKAWDDPNFKVLSEDPESQTPDNVRIVVFDINGMTNSAGRVKFDH